MVMPVAFAEAVAMAWAPGLPHRVDHRRWAKPVGGHRVRTRVAQQCGRGALPGGVGRGDRTGICQDTGTGGLGHGHTLEDIRPG